MTLEQIVTDFGYPAILIGTFLEGETIVVIAGFLAHRDYLSLPLVMLCAFIGTVCSDQLFFLLGHYKGQAFLARRPHWQLRVEKVRGLVQRHGTWIILGFRFIYGIRNVTPLVIGSSGYSRLRFLVLNLIGAGVWAVVFASAGYVLGEAIHRVIGRVHQYEHTIVMGLLATGALIWLAHRIVTRKSRRAARESARTEQDAPASIAQSPLREAVQPRDRISS
jgi:membrane protein DedA with SNARE-associated domain